MTRMNSVRQRFALFALMLSGNFAWGGELLLLDFKNEIGPHATSDAAVERIAAEGGSALRIATGHAQPWPGVTLKAPSGRWDLSSCREVLVDLRNTSDARLTVFCRVDNPGADGKQNCANGSIELEPGKRGVLHVDMKRASDNQLDGKLFGMRGYPVASGGPGTIDAANVTQVLLFVSKPDRNWQFEADRVRASGKYVAPTASVHDAEPYFPLIDTFGQYKHKPWPGKVLSIDDLRSRPKQEARELEEHPGPAEWDSYGGWAQGPQLKTTGFFRVVKHQNKWWLVDPDGHLFWSHGIDCVRMVDATPVEERETWFEDFPGAKPEFRAFLSRSRVLKGHYADRSPECFSFAAANLFRKYGAEWKKVYPDVIHRRLRSWGLNTIANWSDEGVRMMRRTPYTDTISSGRTPMIEGSEGYWGKFPDVFDESFAGNLRAAMENLRGRSAGDPWCIGYFSDNEMSWGDEVSLAASTLKSPPQQAAKREFVRDLQAKYSEIAKLNAAWGTSYPSWEEVLNRREAPDSAKAGDDLKAFYSRLAERYFSGVRDAIRAVSPQQLYLGCRFAWVNDRAAAAAAKYCDVVSYNLYHRSVADFRFNGGADVPLIIGEFHFGALDRGMFHTGLVSVPDQAERAETYRNYVRGAARHPQFVGTHWFQYQDEPTTGRAYDEENYQIGFVDIADTPYAEMISASREVGEQLYRTRIAD